MATPGLESRGNWPRFAVNGGLKLPHVTPPEWATYRSDSPESNASAIGFVQKQLKPFRLNVVNALNVEWMAMEGIVNVSGVDRSRRKNGYYADARSYQEAADLLFAHVKPATAGQVQQSNEQHLGSMQYRWHITHDLTHILSEFLSEPMADTYGPDFPSTNKILVHGRAKSDYGIWEKSQKYHVDSDEIWDVVALQVVAPDTQSARQLHQHILNASLNGDLPFTVMKPHTYRHTEERANGQFELTNRPIRDYLDDNQAYRAARTNYEYIDPLTQRKTIFELQVLPIEVLEPTETWLNTAVHKG